MDDEQDDLPGMKLDKAERAENQIREHAQVVDYQIREYPIEVLVQKYLNGIDDDTNEIFVPDYQRNFVWSRKQQARFIESVLIGLPIPYLFVGDASSDDESLSGRLEVVDGTQRLRTLSAFLSNELKLTKLDKLTALEGMKFSDLLPSRQRRLKRSTIRLIELTEKASEETRRDMFDRINSGGENLKPMEVRRGVRTGGLIPFIGRLAANPKFRKMAPLSKSSISRHDYEELVLRFFAYTENYEKFGHRVIDFINEYLDDKESFSEAVDGVQMSAEWEQMLDFVEMNFSHGFRKSSDINFTPRVRFEAIAVGTALALREKPDLRVTKEEVASWAYGPDFNKLVSADGANSRPRVVARINFVKEKLLGQDAGI